MTQVINPSQQVINLREVDGHLIATMGDGTEKIINPKKHKIVDGVLQEKTLVAAAIGAGLALLLGG
ncbi:MAG: hypothetical protein ACR2P4_00505 [Gammaproteobacteria bacterium]